MRGMKAFGARPARQNFADGGLVKRLKGMIGMDDGQSVRVADNRRAGAAEQAALPAPAAQPKPQPAPEPKAISDYAGNSALRRREQAAGLKDGGPVRGPGTGTSDDVPDEVREGTYIMPADSTQAIGEQALSGMGGERVPVNLSNGEFKLPPEQVHAVGVQALNQMKDATHAQAAQQGRGMKPELFFADGGEVQAQAKKRELGIFPYNHPDAGANIYGVTASASPPAAAKPETPTPLNKLHSAGGRGGMEMIASGLESGARSVAAGLDSGARTFFDSFQKQPESASAAGMPAVRTDVQRGGGNVRANLPPMKPQPAITYTPPPRPAPAAAAPFDFDKFQPKPGEGAFRNEQTGEVTRLQDGPARGMRTWSVPNAVPRSDAPPTSRQDVRAPVLNPNGGVFAAMVDFAGQKAQAVDAIAANKGMRNDRRDDLNELRTNADIAATGGRLAIEGQRTGLDAQRLGLDAQRIAQGDAATRQAGDELAMRQEAAGFQTRAAKRQEDLQTSYQNAKTPEERSAFAKQIRDLAGKGEGDLRDNFMAVGGGQEWDATANTMRNVPQRLVDLRTGKEVGGQPAPRAPAASAAGAGPAAPKTKADYEALPKGAQYIRNGITYTKG